jgi:hypothetical protein
MLELGVTMTLYPLLLTSVVTISKQSSCSSPLYLCDTLSVIIDSLKGGTHWEYMNVSLFDPVCRTFAQCVVDPILGVCQCSYTLVISY